jgi:uncharacterized protein
MPPALLSGVAELVVIERNPELLARKMPFTVTNDPRQLERAGKVVITSSALLDGSMDEVLEHCRGAAFRGIGGPGASFLPDPFFRRGIDVVGGSLVLDYPALAERQRSGEKWGPSTRKYAIRRASWTAGRRGDSA